MKILVCGDIHCKPFLLKQALGCTKWDYFVFLGDACDNWGATQQDNIEMIQLLARVKQKYGDRFVWLIGNHDWGYYDDTVDMSGHIKAGEANVHYLLKENVDNWDLYWQMGNFLFSHAGMSLKFMNTMGDISYTDLKKKIGANNPLNNVGLACGGVSDNPSPLWVRPSEFEPLPDKLGFTQIVGHTPVEKIERSENGCILCDTMSQFPDKTFVGDQTLLVIDGDLSEKPTMKAINPKTGRKKYDID